MFRRLYERLFFCSRDLHRDYGFTTYNLPGGAMRVVKCRNCRNIIDVTYNNEMTVLLKLESELSTLPGYNDEPALERFR